MPQPKSSAPSPRCVELASVFQDPLLEDSFSSNTPAALRHRYAALVAQAQRACHGCPLVEECLYVAVVQHDVAGYVGGTTPEQRLRIRRALRISVAPEDLDTLAGVTGRHRQVDHDEVVRLRYAHPDESLETLAHRLGCSLSTVKRHLRRERRTPSVRRAAPPKPSLSQVLAVAAEVTRAPRTRVPRVQAA
jgi:hypothetical protein